MSALDAYAQPLDQGQQVDQDAATLRLQDVAAHRQDLARQRQAAQDQTTIASQIPIASVDAQQWQQDPQYQVPYAQLPQETQQHFIDAYHPGVAEHAPDIWNEALRGTTGRIPGMENFSPTGATVNAEGKASIQYKPGLQNISPQEEELANAVGDYRIPATGRGGIPNESRGRIMAWLAENRPDFNAQEYQSRQSARTDFKSGQAARNITSANTVVGHLANLSDAADALNNRFLPAWNTVANAAESATGDPRIVRFETARNAVAGELAKLFKGGNASADSKSIEEFRNTINPNMSPDQMKQAIQQYGELMGSRLNALQEQWQKGVKSDRDLPFLTPESVQKLQKLGIDASQYDPVGAKLAPPATQSASPTQLSAADQQAIQWANANPSDPRAASIKALHGIK